MEILSGYDYRSAGDDSFCGIHPFSGRYLGRLYHLYIGQETNVVSDRKETFAA